MHQRHIYKTRSLVLNAPFQQNTFHSIVGYTFHVILGEIFVLAPNTNVVFFRNPAFKQILCMYLVHPSLLLHYTLACEQASGLGGPGDARP